jgi:hypothetical protein
LSSWTRVAAAYSDGTAILQVNTPASKAQTTWAFSLVVAACGNNDNNHCSFCTRCKSRSRLLCTFFFLQAFFGMIGEYKRWIKGEWIVCSIQ